MRASVCVWILEGKVFPTTEVRKKNEWEYSVVRAGPSMSCRGLSLGVRRVHDEINGKRKAERGSGRLFSSLCKRQRLAISLLHRRADQLSSARRSDFGVCQGVRKIGRATAAWIRSIARPRASSSDIVSCNSGLAYSKVDRTNRGIALLSGSHWDCASWNEAGQLFVLLWIWCHGCG